MNFLNIFRKEKKSSAAIAKERLQIIVAHNRVKQNSPDYLQNLQREIIDVIAKYVKIDKDQVHVHLQSEDNCSVLELNVTIPDQSVAEV